MDTDNDARTSVLPALYYPYIHIRSEQWLKATLLTAPTVKRIVPENYTPEDEPNIVRYTTIAGPHGKLLQAVPSFTPAAHEAQLRLLEKLQEHAALIDAKYDHIHAPRGDEYWIHEAKFIGELLNHLKAHHLAWSSYHSHAYGHRTWYALHPVLGKAIMTTLGLSIAREQRYDIVTAEGAFHEALLATNAHDVFDELLRDGPNDTEQTRPQARQDLAQRVVFLTGINYEALRPESIPELQASTQFQSFQRILRAGASTIDVNVDADVYSAQVEEEANHIISAWHDIKRTLGKGVREALFDGALTLGTEVLKALSNPPGKTNLYIAGGLLVYRLTTKGLQLAKDKNSPYQYLSQVVAAQQQALRLMLPLGLER
jgi:hypothetical protein